MITVDDSATTTSSLQTKTVENTYDGVTIQLTVTTSAASVQVGLEAHAEIAPGINGGTFLRHGMSSQGLEISGTAIVGGSVAVGTLTRAMEICLPITRIARSMEKIRVQSPTIGTGTRRMMSGGCSVRGMLLFACHAGRYSFKEIVTHWRLSGELPPWPAAAKIAGQLGLRRS